MLARWTALRRSSRKHYRITLADALNAHERALVRSGGLAGIKSLDDLQSAIGRPYSGYHRPISRKAAALMQAVATNHGFNDGNKRTSVILTDLLLDKSGYRLEPIRASEKIDDAVEALVLAIVEEHKPFEEIVSWFEARIKARK
jgi:death on curing protein